MKVRTWYTPEPTEVEVDVDLVELFAHVLEAGSPESKDQLLHFLLRVVPVLREIPDALIGAIPQAQRDIVARALHELAGRFHPPSQD